MGLGKQCFIFGGAGRLESMCALYMGLERWLLSGDGGELLDFAPLHCF